MHDRAEFFDSALQAVAACASWLAQKIAAAFGKSLFCQRAECLVR
jgi:hypothetical protein